MAGIEVHQIDAAGRLIVTIEDTAEEWAGQILTRLPTVEGVLSTALVYHHCEQ
jgi:nitrate reductase NapD